MMIVSDVSVEMVEQLQEVLDAKAAEMASYRKYVRHNNALNRWERTYKSQLKEVMQVEDRIEEARRTTKLKYLDGKVVLSGNPPMPVIDTSDAAWLEISKEVLTVIRKAEVDCRELHQCMEYYRKAYEEKQALNTACRADERKLNELIDKHGYVYKAGSFSYHSVEFEDGSMACRARGIVVHPLYEAAYDAAGPHNVREKKRVPGPKWAVLDLSEF